MTSRPQKQTRVPHLSRLLRKVGTTNACSVGFDVDVALDVARVERTLLSVALDLGFDLDPAPYTNARATVEERRLQRRVRLLGGAALQRCDNPTPDRGP